ncbi:MAG: hypothetical protein ACYCX4_18185, partial [Bacillota bacterium]
MLYSALLHVRPRSLFVISSRDAASPLDEIAEEASWAGDTTVRLMDDPHSGFNEVEAICAAATPAIIKAGAVVVNITGGTTAMQYVVQQIAGHAVELGRP